LLRQKVQPKKREALERIKKSLSPHSVVAAADLVGVRSTQIQEIRKMLRGKAEMLVAKNTLFKRASQELESNKKNISKFADSLDGPFALLFSNKNPFELILFLNKNKVKVSAKGGDIATGDIVIPAGNTGLPPGPIISEFGEVKIPTKIESGSIWVSKDTVVVKNGDTISTKLASVLTRLGMKPMEAGLSITAAYDNGSILDEKDLTLNLEDYRNQIMQSYKEGLILASEAVYLTPQSTPLILGKAWRQALTLAIKSEYTSPLTTDKIILAAYREMLTLSNKLKDINKDNAPDLTVK
jgi:large subunit ribosomal protein L10